MLKKHTVYIMRQRLLYLLPIILLAFLTACAPPTVKVTLDIEEIENQFAMGDYENAMKSYLALAQQEALASDRTNWLLRASAAAARSDNIHQARQILKTAQPNANNPEHV